MSEQISSNFLIKWPNDSLTNDIYELFTSTDQYEIEKETIFKDPALHYFCLDVDVVSSEDYVVGHIDETPVIVARIVESLMLY